MNWSRNGQADPPYKRIKNAVKAPVYDEFAIGGFKASRTSEFEIK